MKLPVLSGVIKRRLLLNYRLPPASIQPLLPPGMHPQLQQGYAIAGICLIRLEQIRPADWPWFPGLTSENGAHRIAVEQGVYIPRRDSSSWLNQLAGGRIFPGKHHRARFRVHEVGRYVELEMQSDESVLVQGCDSDQWPPDSCFRSLEESSDFFACGSRGYSPNDTGLDAMELRTVYWQARPFAVQTLRSSFFQRLDAKFDHALVMRDIPHSWHEVHFEPTAKKAPVPIKM